MRFSLVSSWRWRRLVVREHSDRNFVHDRECNWTQHCAGGGRHARVRDARQLCTSTVADAFADSLTDSDYFTGKFPVFLTHDNPDGDADANKFSVWHPRAYSDYQIRLRGYEHEPGDWCNHDRAATPCADVRHSRDVLGRLPQLVRVCVLLLAHDHAAAGVVHIHRRLRKRHVSSRRYGGSDVCDVHSNALQHDGNGWRVHCLRRDDTNLSGRRVGHLHPVPCDAVDRR